MTIKSDEHYMSLALELAEKGRGRTSPNPMVGAVLVKGGNIIAEGWHKKAGTPHAEAIALQNAGDDASGATLYVTLEPCCHTDKLTPPCTEAIISHNVARVVIGMVDPNPKVSGNGVKRLRESGIEVDCCVLSERCRELNRAFAKYIRTGMPYVTLKVAQTLDGKIATATGESKWITGPEARRRGHMIRNVSDAIIVGIGTALADNPSLTTRLEGIADTRDPHRIILDSKLRIPLDAKVFNLSSSGRTFIATTGDAPQYKMRMLKDMGVDIIVTDSAGGRVDLPALMKKLAKLGMTNVLIEGGATINAEALRSGIVDRVVFFIAPKVMGGVDSKCSIGGSSPEFLSGAVDLHGVTVSQAGEDLMVEGFTGVPDEGQVNNPASCDRQNDTDNCTSLNKISDNKSGGESAAIEG